MSSAVTAGAAGFPWKRVIVVLAITLVLHGLALRQVNRAFDFDLPPPSQLIQAELFTLPAPIKIDQKAPPPRRARPSRAISAPPPAPPPASSAPGTFTTAPAPQPAPESAPAPVEPAPTAKEAAPIEPPAPPAYADPALISEYDPEGARVLSAIGTVAVSFPRYGRFVSDTTYINGLLRAFGTTTIDWRVQDDRYASTMQVDFDNGQRAFSAVSAGRVDAKIGVAPERYTQRRMSRAEEAANFQWDARKVTFSSTSSEFPLVDGMQDRLSVLAQLALVAQAFPERLVPDQPILLQIVGTRGVSVWDLRMIGRELIGTPAGTFQAIKLDRYLPPAADGKPARELRIELWLVPELRYLPARVRTTEGNGAVIETLLREYQLDE